jgi:hypothetical protein
MPAARLQKASTINLGGLMRRFACFLLFITIITGCAARVVGGNAEGVSVSAIAEDSAGALRKAEEHCPQFGP